MKRNRIICLSIIISLITLLPGCMDKIELEEEGYVAVIGIDKGEGDRLRITYQLINPRASSLGTGGGGGTSGNISTNSEIISVNSPSFLEARDLVSATITRRITLAHAKIMVVGEKLAETEAFFHELESTLREKEMRRSLMIMVSRESAEEFIRRNKPALEDRPEKYFEFISRRWRETGLVPPLSNLNRFMQRTEAGDSLFLTIYGTTKDLTIKYPQTIGNLLPGELDKSSTNPTEIMGAAVFSEGKMIGRLTSTETRLASLLRVKPEVKGMFFTFPDPRNSKFYLSAKIIKSKKTKVKLNLKNEKTILDVTVPISLDVLSIPSFEPYAESLKGQVALKESIARYMEEQASSLIKKVQREFKGDPFLWDLEARKKFLELKKFKAYNWKKKFPSAQVNIHFEVRIKGFGKQLNPPKIIEGS